jgi:hypothetical protein
LAGVEPLVTVNVAHEAPAYTGITGATRVSSGLLLETFTRPRLPVATACDRVTVQVADAFGKSDVGVHCREEIVSPPSSETVVL